MLTLASFALPRRSAHPHHFARGEEEGEIRTLRHHGAATRELACVEVAEQPIIDVDRAFGQLHVTGQRLQQGRLACPVRPNHTEQLTATHTDADAVEQRLVFDAHGEVCASQDGLVGGHSLSLLAVPTNHPWPNYVGRDE